MALDIIEITVSVDGDTPHAIGDVLFNLTEFPLPARACKIINAFYEVETTAIDNHIIRCLFFKSNDGGDLGALNLTADITAANFALNKYIGEIGLICDAGGTANDIDKIDNMMLMQMHNGIGEDSGGGGGGGTWNLVLKGSEDTSFSHGLYVAGMCIVGNIDYTADRTAKLILHVEY